MSTAEKIAVMQAYEEGKQIQCLYEEIWKDMDKEPVWNWGLVEYRVKPEPCVRPYTFEELVEAIKEHGIAVQSKREDTIHTIMSVNRNVVGFLCGAESFHSFLENNIWLDGSPCGVVEE